MISSSRVVLGAGIFLAMLVALPDRADGQTSAYVGWTVRRVRVTGLPDGLSAPFPDGLALAVRSGLLRHKRAPFRPDDLAADEERVRLWLARNGFPNAQVEGRAVPRDGKEEVEVEIAVRPGAGVTIGDVGVEGVPEASKRAERALHDVISGGTVFSDGALRAAAATLELELHRVGHAKASVDVRVERADSVHTDVTFVVDPGPVFTIDEIEVVGAPPDLAPLTERTMGIRPGTQYSPVVLEKARDDLRRLMLFRQVRVRVEENEEGSLRLIAEVAAGWHRSAEFGVGSWTNDPWQFNALWRHRNLFGGGRGLEVRGLYSKWRAELGSMVWWPALLTAHSRLELDGSFLRENEDAFEEREIRAEIANNFRPSFQTTWRLGVAWSDVQVDLKSPDADIGDTEPGRLWSMFGQWRYDGANDLIDPSSGNRFSFVGEYSPEGNFSDSPFVSGDGSMIQYFPVRRRMVLAARAELGLARPLADNEVLPSRRFFAGGVNSQRGYGRRRLGPRDSANNPIGGEALVLLNAEARFPLVSRFRGALFLDVGQVWPTRNDIDLAELQVALGTGIVLATAVGPIRLDYAYLLTEPMGGDRPWQIHFAIGYAY